MAKRFTDTNKYKKPFIRSLQGAYKLFWDYLYHDCDHAGIWIVDMDIAQIYLGSDMIVDEKKALELFNKIEQKIIVLDNGKKWFIPSFIDFQYGELNPSNRAHNSVLQILKKENLYDENKGLIRGLQAPMDKDKDNDKEKDKDKDDYLNFISIEKSEIFKKWIDYKKEIKKPYKSKTSINSLAEKFNSEPLVKCEWVVNNSIQNNYQGLFWDNYKSGSEQKNIASTFSKNR